MAKNRTARRKAIGSEPIPIRLLNSKTNDFSIETRVDGPTGSYGTRPGRKRPPTPPTLELSLAQQIQAIAAWSGLWEVAASLAAQETPRAVCGRPRECTPADIMLFSIMNTILRSARATERFLRDPVQRKLICDAAVAAYPDDPTRRLSVKGTSRKQFSSYRKTHIEFDDAIEKLGAKFEELCLRIAIDIGVCNQRRGSWTEPASENILRSDGTWIPSLYNSASPTWTDPETAEIIPTRFDPDATVYGEKSQRNGNMLVPVIARNPHPNERLILNFDYRPHRGASDATVATDLTLRLIRRLPGIQGLAYDMAMHATDYDRLLSAGIIPISKVQRTKSHKVQALAIDVPPFTLSDGTNRHLAVTAYDGTPHIDQVIGDEVCAVPLRRVSTIRRKNKDGSFRIYVTWAIPDRPDIDRNLRNATVEIRHNSTKSEVADNRRRTRGLRVVPESDDSFDRLFGHREDSESTNHHLKMTYPNGRARSVGRHRQFFDLFGYQAHLAITTLLAWNFRTGGDIGQWFGRWRPPERVSAKAA